MLLLYLTPGKIVSNLSQTFHAPQPSPAIPCFAADRGQRSSSVQVTVFTKRHFASETLPRYFLERRLFQ